VTRKLKEVAKMCCTCNTSRRQRLCSYIFNITVVAVGIVTFQNNVEHLEVSL